MLLEKKLLLANIAGHSPEISEVGAADMGHKSWAITGGGGEDR